MEPIQIEKPPLHLLQIIKDALKLYKNYFVTFLAISIVYSSISLFSIVFEEQTLPRWTGTIVWLPGFVLSLWASIALIYASSEAHQQGQTSLQTAFSRTRGHFWMFIFVGCFVSLLSGIGYFLLIIPGIYLSVIFFLADISAALDDKPFFDHFRISKLLTKGYFWKVLLLNLIIMLPWFGFMAAYGFFWGNQELQQLNTNTSILTLVWIFVLPVISITKVLLYNKLKNYKQLELERFADAKRLKGSQRGLGILSCTGLALGILSVIAVISFSFVFFFKNFSSGKICPLPQAPKQSVLSYIKDGDRLSGITRKSRRIEKDPFILYIPGGIDVNKSYPLLIVLSPNANPEPLIASWKEAAEKHKWILYGSRKYRNRIDMGKQSKQIVDILDEIFTSYPVSRDMVLVGGISGGGMGSHGFSYLYPDMIKAVVSNTGMIHRSHLKDKENYPKGKFAVFLASPTDFRYEEMMQDRQFLQDLGWKTRWIEFPGGHILAPSATYLEAAQWLQKFVIEGQPVVQEAADGPKTSHVPLEDGLHKEYYPNGTVSVDVTYVKGQRHGPYTAYYPNGTVWSSGQYVKDKKDEKFIVYNEDGSTQVETRYNDGVRHGAMRIFENNQVVEDNIYENGEMVRHQHYSDGKLIHIDTHRNGEIISHKHIGKDGKVSCEIPYIDGKPQANYWKIFFKNLLGG